MTIPWTLIGSAVASFFLGRETATSSATNWQLILAAAAGAVGGFLLGKAVSE